MKKTGLFIFLCGLFLAMPCSADITYRNFIWGAEPKDVRAFEKAIFYKEEEDSLYFLEDKNERRTIIRYDFHEGHLWRIRFDYFELAEPQPQTIMDLLMAEQAELTKLYGKPSNEELVWKKKKYRNHPKFWSRALGNRDLIVRTEWKDEHSTILLESFRNKDDQFYTLGYTIENIETAAKLEADKLKLDWKAP